MGSYHRVSNGNGNGNGHRHHTGLLGILQSARKEWEVRE